MNLFKNLDKNVLSLGIAIIAIAIAGALILTNESSGQFLDKIKSFTSGGMSKEDLAKKGIDYINNNVLSGQKAVLVDVSEESGLVKVKISIEGKEFDSYMTKDGKLLFPESIKLEETSDSGNQPANNPPNQPTKTKADVVKADKAELDAYIVSQCPFGLQMQRALNDVVNSAPSLTQNIKVRYIGSISNGRVIAMHGDAEAQENFRQICIREEQASKYWSYVSCYIKAGDTAGCLTSAGIDNNKLNGCTSDKNRGLVYAKEDFDLNAKYDIKGSPTLVLNNQVASEFDFGGRTSEALKTLICYGSKNESKDCSKTLNTVQAATSFSETYSKPGNSVNSGANNVNCNPA
ncbi:MAG: hypothetical protein HY005_02745 [Candidatus Staskawiczbacteria bacterium]|nr:hypothetical protein [Candidatus Staskawiczbacteria bacterium]